MPQFKSRGKLAQIILEIGGYHYRQYMYETNKLKEEGICITGIMERRHR